MKILGRILLGLLSLILALGLFCTNLYVASLGTLHYLYSEERITAAISELDFAAIQLPLENGEIGTLGEIVGNSVASGIVVPPETVNSLIHSLSLDKVLTSFLLDLRHWAFENGPVPHLDAEEIADTIIAGANDELREHLYISEETKIFIAEGFAEPLAQIDWQEPLAALSPARVFISQGTLVFSLTAASLLFLLLLITRRLRLCPTMIITGSVCLVNGTVFLLLPLLMDGVKESLAAEMGLPLPTVELFWQPLTDAVATTGLHLALFGGSAVLLFSIIGLILLSLRKRKARRALAAVPAEEASLSAATEEMFPSPAEEESVPSLSEKSEN